MYRSRKPGIPHGIRGFESPLLCKEKACLTAGFFFTLRST